VRTGLPLTCTTPAAVAVCFVAVLPHCEMAPQTADPVFEALGLQQMEASAAAAVGLPAAAAVGVQQGGCGSPHAATFQQQQQQQHQQHQQQQQQQQAAAAAAAAAAWSSSEWCMYAQQAAATAAAAAAVATIGSLQSPGGAQGQGGPPPTSAAVHQVDHLRPSEGPISGMEGASNVPSLPVGPLLPQWPMASQPPPSMWHAAAWFAAHQAGTVAAVAASQLPHDGAEVAVGTPHNTPPRREPKTPATTPGRVNSKAIELNLAERTRAPASVDATPDPGKGRKGTGTLVSLALATPPPRSGFRAEAPAFVPGTSYGQAPKLPAGPGGSNEQQPTAASTAESPTAEVTTVNLFDESDFVSSRARMLCLRCGMLARGDVENPPAIKFGTVPRLDGASGDSSMETTAKVDSDAAGDAAAGDASTNQGALILQLVRGDGGSDSGATAEEGSELLRQLQQSGQPNSEPRPVASGLIGSPGRGKARQAARVEEGIILPTTPPRTIGRGQVGGSPSMKSPASGDTSAAIGAGSPTAHPGGKAAGKGESRSKIRASAAAARASPEALKDLTEACSSPWSASTAAGTEGTDAEESAGGGAGGGGGGGGRRRRGGQRRAGERQAATQRGDAGAQTVCGVQKDGRTTAAGAQPRVARRGTRRARGRSGSATKYQ